MVKVVDSTEKGKRVFKKPQENIDEEKYFYNEKYFADIGFPETKVYEGEMTADGIMRGGYYDHPDKLTDPFSIYVKYIQGFQNTVDDVDVDEDEKYLTPIASEENVKNDFTFKDNAKSDKGFFDRIGEYGNNVSEYIKTNTDKFVFQRLVDFANIVTD